MGSYKEITGDLIALAKEKQFDIIAHGCNCLKTMGAGIALTIGKEFPSAKLADSSDSRLNMERLGDMTVATTKEGFLVLNLYTQFNLGKDLQYPALALCFYKINSIYPNKSIGLPLIGCGIAGGEWKIVKSMIKSLLKDMHVTVVHYVQNSLQNLGEHTYIAAIPKDHEYTAFSLGGNITINTEKALKNLVDAGMVSPLEVFLKDLTTLQGYENIEDYVFLYVHLTSEEKRVFIEERS